MAAAGFAAVAALQEIVRGKDVFAVFDVVIFAFNDWGQVVGFLFGIGGHLGRRFINAPKSLSVALRAFLLLRHL